MISCGTNDLKKFYPEEYILVTSNFIESTVLNASKAPFEKELEMGIKQRT